MGTLKLPSNEPLYSNTVNGTLAVDIPEQKNYNIFDFVKVMSKVLPVPFFPRQGVRIFFWLNSLSFS